MSDEPAHPMSSPAPFLVVVSSLAILLLGSLMLIDVFWQASGPETVTTASAPATPQAELKQATPGTADQPVQPPG